MENTVENKRKFFAQYFGQQVLRISSTNLKYVDTNWNWGHPSHYLELTPLSKISDEDAIEMANIIGNCSHISDESKVSQLNDLLSTPNFSNKQTNISASKWLVAFQTLTAKGYALPFHDLSIETLITYGWLKLKS